MLVTRQLVRLNHVKQVGATSSRMFSVSRSSAVTISEEVKQALEDKQKPVVSLESTIITHGLPYPENLSMARRVESVIRENGAIPATCAFIKGQPLVGLDESQLEHLAHTTSPKPNKVSRRDIGYTMSTKQNGGTTIASTMILSEMAGIKVFATGGLGGVHRDGQNTLDVSADLTELGRTPVSVVCAGPKSILDIGLTLEYLETQGVFVGTYNDDGRENIQVPGFYTRDSGFQSPYSFSSFEQAASIIHNQNNIMGLKSGQIFCIPPSRETALPSELMQRVIAAANEEAIKLGIQGKELTPFLLSKIAQETKGQSVHSNIELVLNNARSASQIAKELLSLETNRASSQFQPSTNIKKRKMDEGVKKVDEKKQDTTSVSDIPTPSVVNTIVVGSLALDSICKISSNVIMNDSNPGTISSSVGGVGFNVAKACSLALKSPSCSNGTSRLVSIVSNDMAGHTIIGQLKKLGIDTSGILVDTTSGCSTAQYTSTHANNGDLIIACADMKIAEYDGLAQHVLSEIKRGSPRQIVVDCNVSSSTLSTIFDYVRESNLECNVIVEPTSSPKSKRISLCHSRNLRPFPNNSVSLITPTVGELDAIHSALAERELFDDYDHWFPLLDSLGIDSTFREKLSISKHPVLKNGLELGYLQQAFSVLPYIPNILLKLGEQGVLSMSISTNVEDYKSIPTTSVYSPEFTIVTSTGRSYTADNGSQQKMGLVIQYFPIPPENGNITIENVTGAGDSFLGYLMARMSTANTHLVEGTWLTSEVGSVEREWFKWESIHKAQLASGKSLQSLAAISEDIATIE
ncbi:hypothetical protein CAAN4_A00804 [[Candida] anglica]|uniref:Carbohydrate kinase PfkB domain-containing protein n=1 Tax=[Candida] anglica TaxID=148631 RepID=A0ABP0E567_9ASCO